ncbi:hypothetical protein BDV37DRAFT_242391 [Aspergillus pseudonomiae]|uniref:C2H2-type domain-containing protein n=1 Tax=Aspergillus pseudonomiae TaxID=1506151 RepID=A0A5N7DL33_9EURO|nr:uncharacterized protein BDV37DRAFT_242391 [Aspergillus pseudonomiae]KAE8406683.1 hypothetical protein BDV37DRAFT_242391 [Aspergillus pseudonomiae]
MRNDVQLTGPNMDPPNECAQSAIDDFLQYLMNLKPTPSLHCFEHGCNGRRFSTRTNYIRHLKEQSGSGKLFRCPTCAQSFTRSTAKNIHVS